MDTILIHRSGYLFIVILYSSYEQIFINRIYISIDIYDSYMGHDNAVVSKVHLAVTCQHDLCTSLYLGFEFL